MGKLGGVLQVDLSMLPPVFLSIPTVSAENYRKKRLGRLYRLSEVFGASRGERTPGEGAPTVRFSFERLSPSRALRSPVFR